MPIDGNLVENPSSCLQVAGAAERWNYRPLASHLSCLLNQLPLFKYQSLVSSDFLLCLSPQICRPMRAALLLEGSDEENLLESSMLLPAFSAIPWAFPLLRGE